MAAYGTIIPRLIFSGKNPQQRQQVQAIMAVIASWRPAVNRT